jgi:hypothetical protein
MLEVMNRLTRINAATKFGVLKPHLTLLLGLLEGNKKEGNKTWRYAFA